MIGNWNFPTSIRFGAGRLAELPDACRELGMQRPLLVTDPGLSALPMVARARQVNEQAGLPTGLFDGVRPNPVGRNVEEGVAAFRAGNHDGVVGMGGGSALDVAKAVALMVGQDRPLFDFEDREDWHTRVKVEGMAPVAAVPTTAGTGSEVGRVSVITDEACHVKKLIFHAKMQPARVILDPELTLGLPPALTAYVGMDALAHSLEAFLSPVFHPQADGIALESMRMISQALVRCHQDGQDLEARSLMLAASMMGAAAFQKGLGAIHAMSHPLGARFDTHHGLTNAVVMPYVVAFNRPATAEKQERLARYLGLRGGLLDWVLELRSQLGIPHTLAELGVTEGFLDWLSEQAAADPSAGTNPVPLNVTNLRQLFAQALQGQVASPAAV